MHMHYKMQNDMVNDCFQECINTFGENKLTHNEKECLTNCSYRAVATMDVFGDLTERMEQKNAMNTPYQF